MTTTTAAASTATRYRVIILDPTSESILALPVGDRWRLPEWVDAEPANWEDVSAVNAGVMAFLGLTVATLRALKLDWSDAQRTSYYLAESMDPDWSPPPDAEWIPTSDAPGFAWQDVSEAAQIAGWLSERPSPTRVPWYRPGWFRTFKVWIAGALDEVGIAPTGPVEQLRAWERCSLFRAPTSAGAVYAKAVPPQWGHEPVLTSYLAQRFPDHSPEVIALDAARGYMLLADFGGCPLVGVHDLDAWRAAYATLARMQRELAGRVDELGALGVPLRGPAEVQPRIAAMLADERRLRLGMPHGLDAGQVALLRVWESRLVAACGRLAAGPIPLSLDHGDFWPGNLRWRAAGPLIFDWSDAAITHPFFSLVMAADEIAGSLPDIEEAGQQVIDAYLSEWDDVAPLPELRTIFDDAMLVAPVCQALMYRDIYLPAMEFIDELDRMPVVHLRWLAGRLK